MRCVLVFIVFLLVGGNIHAVNGQPILRHDTWKCLHRTGTVLFEAQKDVKAGKVYTGDLARAIEHQCYAKKLFIDGKYLAAIYHSMEARHLAFTAIEANKGVVKPEWKSDPNETWYEKSSPSDKELDSYVPNYNKLRDQDAINMDMKELDMDVEN